MKTSLFAYVIKFRRAISAICAGLALLIITSALTGQHPENQVIVVATHDISPGTHLVSGDLAASTISTHAPWHGLFTSMHQAMGRTTSHAISSGQPLSSSDVVGNQLLGGLSSGTVAVEISASQISNASTLQAGSHIDLYSTSTTTQPGATLIAHDVIVVAQNGAGGSTTSSNGLAVTSPASALIVAVSPSQARNIAARMNNSQLVAVLLNS